MPINQTDKAWAEECRHGRLEGESLLDTARARGSAPMIVQALRTVQDAPTSYGFKTGFLTAIAAAAVA